MWCPVSYAVGPDVRRRIACCSHALGWGVRYSAEKHLASNLADARAIRHGQRYLSAVPAYLERAL